MRKFVIAFVVGLFVGCSMSQEKGEDEVVKSVVDVVKGTSWHSSASADIMVEDVVTSMRCPWYLQRKTQLTDVVSSIASVKSVSNDELVILQEVLGKGLDVEKDRCLDSTEAEQQADQGDTAGEFEDEPVDNAFEDSDGDEFDEYDNGENGVYADEDDEDDEDDFQLPTHSEPELYEDEMEEPSFFENVDDYSDDDGSSIDDEEDDFLSDSIDDLDDVDDERTEMMEDPDQVNESAPESTTEKGKTVDKKTDSPKRPSNKNRKRPSCQELDAAKTRARKAGNRAYGVSMKKSNKALNAKLKAARAKGRKVAKSKAKKAFRHAYRRSMKASARRWNPSEKTHKDKKATAKTTVNKKAGGDKTSEDKKPVETEKQEENIAAVENTEEKLSAMVDEDEDLFEIDEAMFENYGGMSSEMRDTHDEDMDGSVFNKLKKKIQAEKKKRLDMINEWKKQMAESKAKLAELKKQRKERNLNSEKMSASEAELNAPLPDTEDEGGLNEVNVGMDDDFLHRRMLDDITHGQQGSSMFRPPGHTCPAGQVWHTCDGARRKTCADPLGGRSRKCVARCACPRRTPIHHNGMCIRFNDCPADTQQLVEP